MDTTRRSVLRGAASAAALLATPALAQAPTEIELFFPVPVDGQLARDMATLLKEFNEKTPSIRATPVYTGSYDETLIKTRAAMKAGKPPAVTIMSANFLLDLKIEGEIQPLDELIRQDGRTNETFMAQFFKALHGNSVLDRSVYGVPFHNSTPLLYANADHLKEAGLDPETLPQDWTQLLAATKALTRRDGDRVTRWGISAPSSYDYGGWILQALTHSNGGQWFNPEYGGEVYYNTPSMLGALTYWSDLVSKHRVHPAGTQAGGAVSTAFLSGQASTMLLSTGSLTHIRRNAKFPYQVGFVPRNLRNEVPIGGASLVIPAGVEGARLKAAWTLINWMTSPEKSGWWSRATGYFAPNVAAYDAPEMKAFMKDNPDAEVAVRQLAVAKPWFATFKTVPVRKAIEDELQAVLSGKKTPKEALAAAQANADAILKPYVDQTALKLPS